jgi:hypothetical protein
VIVGDGEMASCRPVVCWALLEDDSVVPLVDSADGIRSAYLEGAVQFVIAPGQPLHPKWVQQLDESEREREEAIARAFRRAEEDWDITPATPAPGRDGAGVRAPAC